MQLQQVNGVNVYTSDPTLLYGGLDQEPTWFSAQGGVYQCYERTTHRPVAIKKYLVEEHQHPDMFVMPKELVENEIYTMTKCNHNNILKLYSVHLFKEFVYLVMPLCAGGSLQQYVYEHHLTIGQLSFIVASIAAGLEEIHRHGYIHRDIKCDNIFLDRDLNKIVIGDFGVVSITPAADSSVEEAGVVLFWAPELVRGKMVNRKVDIWALGIVILEIINGGRAPYEDEKLDDEQIKQRILANGKPAFPQGLPSRLVNLLDACLNTDPRGRASAADILKHPFITDYHHEPLFTSIPESAEAKVDADAMLDALKSLQAMKSIDELDKDMAERSSTKLTRTSNLASSTAAPHVHQYKARSRKCRLPVPAFTLDQDKVNAVPAKEKIASVQQNRRSLSAEHRSQGSRLPMLKIILASCQEADGHQRPGSPPLLLSPTGKKLRKAKSVRLPSLRAFAPKKQRAASPPPSTTNSSTKPLPPIPSAADQPVLKKPPVRNVKSPVQKHFTTRSKPSSLSVPPSPAAAADVFPTTTLTTDMPLRSSDYDSFPGDANDPSDLEYRPKRLPQSRTARLMMGISTTGRQSSRSPPASPDHTLSTSAKRFSSLTASLSTHKRPDLKPRPLSFSGPKSTTSSARQPVPPLPPFPPHLKHQPPQPSFDAPSQVTSPRRRHFSVPSSKRDRSSPDDKPEPLQTIEALSAY